MHPSHCTAAAGLCQTGPCRVLKSLMSWFSDSLKRPSLLSLSSKQTVVELLLLLVDDELSRLSNCPLGTLVVACNRGDKTML